MDYVFTTDSYAQRDRYAAWRDAICDVYVNVDVEAADPEHYRGFIREARFGEVSLTDILLSGQRILRGRSHIARQDKDCCYLQFILKGSLNVQQNGISLPSNIARGVIFSAVEEYELRALGEVRSLYLELPRAAFAQRFPGGEVPLVAGLDITQGLGRLAAEMCSRLAAESHVIPEGRDRAAEALMDVLALALQCAAHDIPLGEASVRAARLTALKAWVEAHLADPELSPRSIAKANGVSLRQLHALFQDGGESVADWLWSRRCQQAFDRLVREPQSPVTQVAFDLGYSSSSHFSTQFRRRYGISPRELRNSGGRAVPV
ncbi:helix-turn-helix domain-containing protein [Falsigemmobacter faecalis]|uniref:Helix-turn-helix domain-containing protein n=1 Tax=Falsigemmobacter faecalis TaxID=2488730 RepID=A0A3P3D5Z5_9RHOB|nr:helix-turn-helix domain-containing protein [Falsigemmobacter faecalis]RRH69779.1 helix-turn-helix domain-containing protein [Falsigemmobacter faecalis]